MAELNRGITNTETLRTDLAAFTGVIASFGREYGLNPHLEFWEVQSPDTPEGGVISAISKTGLLNETITRLEFGGNVGRILQADKEYRKRGYDYLFVHKPESSSKIVQSINKLARKVSDSMGIRVLVLPSQ